MNNAMDELSRIKEMNRVKAKRYYDLHKIEINERKRAKYATKNAVIEFIEPVIEVIEPVIEVIEPVSEVIEPVSEVIEPTISDVIEMIQEQPITENTMKSYVGNMNRFKIVLVTDSVAVFRDFDNVKARLDVATKSNGELYSVNTKKTMYQTITYIIDHFNLAIDKLPYVNEFEIKKIESIKQNQELKTKVVPKFSSFVLRCRHIFGEKSKEFLIINLYDEMTLRDDYGLKISDNERDANKQNILLLKNGKMEIIISKYKTVGKYGKIRHTPSDKIQRMILEYIQSNGLKDGQLLFGADKLSSFIVNMNKKLQLNGGVSLYRHMKITEILQDATPAQRVELAEKMKHSTAVQLEYMKTN